MNSDKEITELVYRSCLMLDELNFSGYLDLCSPDFRYRIVAYSPELQKDMIWQDVDKEALKRHFDLIPKHVRELVSLARFPTLYLISYDQDGRQASVLSGMQVFKTKLDGGQTSMYAICRLHDVVDLNNGRARLRRREIRMETRQLGTGSQILF